LRERKNLDTNWFATHRCFAAGACVHIYIYLFRHGYIILETVIYTYAYYMYLQYANMWPFNVIPQSVMAGRWRGAVLVIYKITSRNEETFLIPNLRWPVKVTRWIRAYDISSPPPSWATILLFFLRRYILGSGLLVYKSNINYTVYKEPPPWLITQSRRRDNILCKDYIIRMKSSILHRQAGYYHQIDATRVIDFNVGTYITVDCSGAYCYWDI